MAIKMHILKMAKNKKISGTKTIIHSGVRVAKPNNLEQP